MRHAASFAAVTLVLAVSSPAAAQNFTFKGDLFGQKKPSPKPPPVDWSVKSPVAPFRPAEPSVVCGMTMVPADPAIDPAFRQAPPQTGVKFALKVVEPTVCRAPQR